MITQMISIRITLNVSKTTLPRERAPYRQHFAFFAMPSPPYQSEISLVLRLM